MIYSDFFTDVLSDIVLDELAELQAKNINLLSENVKLQAENAILLTRVSDLERELNNHNKES